MFNLSWVSLLCVPLTMMRISCVFWLCKVKPHRGSLFVTRGRTCMSSYHKDIPVHFPTFVHSHSVPVAHTYVSDNVSACLCIRVSVCVCVCVYWAMVRGSPPSHGVCEDSQRNGTAHNPVHPCRPLPWLPVPSDLDWGQSSRPSKQYRARALKTAIAIQCIPLRSLGTPVFVQLLWKQKEEVWRDY